MRAWFAVLLIALMPFAGCLDDNSGGLATAKEALPAAQSEARKWNADAQLASASGFELGAEAREEIRAELQEARDELAEAHAECSGVEDSEEQQACHDGVAEAEKELATMEAVLAAGNEKVGDGVAPLWMFGFVAPDVNGLFAVAVSGSRVLMSEEIDGDLDGIDMPFGFAPTPLGGWKLDSTAATKVAADEIPNYSELAAAPSAQAMSVLMQAGERALWVVGIETDEGEGFIAIDANNGTLVDLNDIIELFPILQEEGSGSGTFTAVVGTTQRLTFEVEQQGHEALALTARISPAPLQPVRVVVTDSRGAQSSFSVQMGMSGPTGATGSIVIADVPAGPFTVTLTAGVATRENWNVHWCTDGWALFSSVYFNPGQPNACALIPDSNFAASSPSEMISHWRGLLGL